MNVLLIGLGRWGEKHLRVLRELGLHVWVADLLPARRAWAEKQGIPPSQVVSRYQDALPSVEAVVVVTPADTHGALVETCLAAGKHCFVEKPLGLTAAEGRGLATAAVQAGRLLQVGHILRFHPVTRTLQEALADGRIGTIRYASGRFAGFKRPRTDVGVTHTDAIHYFDLFGHLLEREATSVLAFQRDFLGRGLDDLSVTCVNFGDVPAIVEANYFAPGTQRECVLVGERGSLVADYASGTVTLHAVEFARGEAAWEALDRGKENLPVGEGEPLQRELAAFLSACTGAGPNLVPAEAGIRAVAVVEAATRSAALGRLINLVEIP
jgi:predicted dehydrogenase